MRNWDSIYKARGEVVKDVLPKIKKIVPIFKKEKVEKILDLGCGTGRHTIFLARHGFNVTSVDISKAAIDIIRKKIKKLEIKNVQLVDHDMESIPFPDGYFDAVICTGVLSHGVMNKIKMTVKEIHRVLGKRGILIADVMSTKDPDYGAGKEIERETFIGLKEEEDTPHHYFTKDEVLDVFYQFKKIVLRHRTEKISYKKRKNRTSSWQILAKR